MLFHHLFAIGLFAFGSAIPPDPFGRTLPAGERGEPAREGQQTDSPDSPDATAPNFLLVYLDDVGLDQLAVYDEVNAYRAAEYDYPYAHTPTIDALAARGLRFDQARGTPLCSPSRASLHSGRYDFRTGVGNSIGYLRRCGYYEDMRSPSFREYSRPPRPQELNLPQLLGSVGYRSALVGKLHLAVPPGMGGAGPDYARRVLGYGDFFGTLGNLDNRPFPPNSGATRGFSHYLWFENGKRSERRQYCTMLERERLQDWLREERREPFLAVWSAHEAHSPFEWPPPSEHGFGPDAPEVTNFDPWINTRVRAKIELFDRQLGLLLDSIPAAVLERTWILLLGDNGGDCFRPALTEICYPEGHPLHRADDHLRPLRTDPYTPEQGKRTAYEGGVRVPLIVAGPGVRHPGTSCAALVDTVDVFPTMAALAKVSARDLTRARLAPAGTIDGKSFAGLLAGSDPEVHTRQFSYGGCFLPNGVGEPIEFEHRFYVRRDPRTGLLWKVVRLKDEVSDDHQDEFYELISDPMETNDLGTQHPEYEATRAAFEALLYSPS